MFAYKVEQVFGRPINELCADGADIIERMAAVQIMTGGSGDG